MEHIDREELAWAAGFFDGEGSTFCQLKQDRPRYRRQLVVAVGQSGREIPEVLQRFQRALLGIGKIYGPYIRKGRRLPTWQWRALSFEEAQAAIAMLWRFLSPIKQRQASGALCSYGDRRLLGVA